jgi:hypothetical protein
MAEKLTDRAFIVGAVAQTDLLHIVDVSDNSQDPAGSSFKVTSKDFINSYITDGSEGAMPYWDNTSGKYIPISTSGIFHDVSNNRIGVGINTSLTAKLHVKSATGTAFQVDGSTISSTFKVEDGGTIRANNYEIFQAVTNVYFKNYGSGKFFWDRNNGSRSLMYLSNEGQVFLNTDTDSYGTAPVFNAFKFTSSASKETIANFYKNTTDKVGLAIFATDTKAFIQGLSISNTATIDLILGGQLNSGQLDTLTLKSSGVVNIANIPTSASGLATGDIWSNLGILTIVP